MVDQHVLEGHWQELTDYLRQRWNQLEAEDLERVKGNLNQLLALIQDKTGWTRERIEGELDAWIAQGKSLANRATGAVRGFADHAGEQVQQGYDQAEQLVQRRPVESVAVAFGTGLIAGVIVGLILRSK